MQISDGFWLYNRLHGWDVPSLQICEYCVGLYFLG
uniref:Uncharacterized protein n=1 Tax=Lepeophtheirus salmonis TaxID=72036 RepID=A0A0K2T9Y6_LEPSM